MKKKKVCDTIWNEIIKSKYYKSIEKKTGEKVIFFFPPFLLIFAIIWLAGIDAEYFDDLKVEAGGFLLDILLFGVILGFYDHVKSKTKKIEHYIEEIDDYRGWKEKESGYRVFGNIKRLRKLEVYDYDLTSCYFEDVEFKLSHTWGG